MSAIASNPGPSSPKAHEKFVAILAEYKIGQTDGGGGRELFSVVKELDPLVPQDKRDQWEEAIVQIHTRDIRSPPELRCESWTVTENLIKAVFPPNHQASAAIWNGNGQVKVAALAQSLKTKQAMLAELHALSKCQDDAVFETKIMEFGKRLFPIDSKPQNGMIQSDSREVVFELCRVVRENGQASAAAKGEKYKYDTAYAQAVIANWRKTGKLDTNISVPPP